MADIFISYAREDAGWVEKVAAQLESAGYSVWWDRNLATGARYLKETEAQLRAAKATVVVWSKTSLDSHWVADEAGLARDLGRLAPISKDGSMPPLGFGQYQATDFSRWHGGEGEPMPTLLRAIAEMSGREAPPAAKPRSARRISPLVLIAAALLAMVIAGVATWSTGVFGGARIAPGSASVAVTPFKDLSQAGDQGHLANGMTVEVLSRLRTIDKLTVAGGDWMAQQIKDIGGDPQALGQKLGVNYILEGDVFSEGDNIRVSARLVRASDRAIIWAPKPYERAKNSIFAIQQEIAASVANALSVTLDIGLQSTGYGGTKTFEAYDHYLRGLLLRNVGDPMLAVNELTQAVTLDPNYARAWAELTISWGTVARNATTPEEIAPSLKKMDEASSTAQRLAPKMWFGHTPRGWYLMGRNEWVDADKALRRALELGDVADPEFYQTEAAFANQVGRVSVTERMQAKIFAIDPHFRDHDLILLQRYLVRRNFAEFWPLYDANRKQFPQLTPLRESTALWAALADGKMDRAHSIMKEFGATNQVYADIEKGLDYPKDSLVAIRGLENGPAIGRGGFTLFALLAGQYGDPELAVQLLRRGFIGPGWAGNFQIWFPQLAEARKTESFKQFVRDIGWEKMWRTSGDWGDFCKPVSDTDFTCT